MRSDPRAILRASSAAELSWIAAAIGLVLLDRALNAYRWLVLLRSVAAGTRPRLASVLRIFFVSSFVGNFLPSIGGDVYRAYQLARVGVRAGEAAASVLMDRAIGVLSMVVVAASAFWLLPDVDVAGVVPALVVAAVCCAAAAAVVFSERAASTMTRVGSLVPAARVQRLSSALLEAVRGYAGHRGVLVTVLTASIGVQLLRIVQAYCLGRGLHIDQPLTAYLAFVPLATLAMQLPITIAGLGVSQYAFERLFGYVGVAPAQSVALSILFVALGTLGNLPGGLIYAWQARQDPAMRQTPSQERVGP